MSMEKVAKVNEILLKGEPANISVDEHSGYTGYKPQAVVDAMNEVFWGEWGFEEVSSEITPGEKGLAIAQVRVWLKDIDFKPTSYGQNRVTRGDIGDARKGAQTDAIKKALSYFSIGNRAYHGSLPNKQEQAQAARQQVGNQRPPTTPAARSAQATTKPAQEAAAPAENSNNASKLPRYQGMADLYYPGGWKALATSVAQAANVIGLISDEQIIIEYLPEVQAAIKPHMPEKKPVAKAS